MNKHSKAAKLMVPGGLIIPGMTAQEKRDTLRRFCIANRICTKTSCCNFLTTEEGNTCYTCMGKDRERRRNLVAKGLCTKCSTGIALPPPKSHPPSETNARCETCYFKGVVQGLAKHYHVPDQDALWKGIRALWYSMDEHVCRYFKWPLELGVNTQLDHILPTKRWPELAADLSNMQWISWKANQFKGDRTHDEIIVICNCMAYLHPVELF